MLPTLFSLTPMSFQARIWQALLEVDMLIQASPKNPWATMASGQVEYSRKPIHSSSGDSKRRKWRYIVFQVATCSHEAATSFWVFVTCKQSIINNLIAAARIHVQVNVQPIMDKIRHSVPKSLHDGNGNIQWISARKKCWALLEESDCFPWSLLILLALLVQLLIHSLKMTKHEATEKVQDPLL